jgi:hypothetical protein
MPVDKVLKIVQRLRVDKLRKVSPYTAEELAAQKAAAAETNAETAEANALAVPQMADFTAFQTGYDRTGDEEEKWSQEAVQNHEKKKQAVLKKEAVRKKWKKAIMKAAPEAAQKKLKEAKIYDVYKKAKKKWKSAKRLSEILPEKKRRAKQAWMVCEAAVKLKCAMEIDIEDLPHLDLKDLDDESSMDTNAFNTVVAMDEEIAQEIAQLSEMQDESSLDTDDTSSMATNDSMADRKGSLESETAQLVKQFSKSMDDNFSLSGSSLDTEIDDEDVDALVREFTFQNVSDSESSLDTSGSPAAWDD